MTNPIPAVIRVAKITLEDNSTRTVLSVVTAEPMLLFMLVPLHAMQPTHLRLGWRITSKLWAGGTGKIDQDSQISALRVLVSALAKDDERKTG
jgi:hypothetical protein